MAESPWDELVRMTDVLFDRAHLPSGVDAVRWSDGRRTLILLDRSLDRAGRRAALAHELEHHRRGGGACQPAMPPTWRAVARREEEIVDRAVARRLVPQDDLVAFIVRQGTIGEPVTALDVAEQFDVPPAVADRALQLLKDAGW
jgi:hypothetical protein